MRERKWQIAGVLLLGGLLGFGLASRRDQLPAYAQNEKNANPVPASQVQAQPAAGAEDADRAAIQKAAQAFAAAFNKADAKAIAAMWTENGENREASGQTFVGRAAIEKAHLQIRPMRPTRLSIHNLL